MKQRLGQIAAIAGILGVFVTAFFGWLSHQDSTKHTPDLGTAQPSTSPTFSRPTPSNSRNSSTPAGPVNGCSNLLAQPGWHLEASDGASEQFVDLSTNNPNVLVGKKTIRITYNLHGLTATEGPRKDASAIIFNQPTWYVISLANYGSNGLDGEQTVNIPLHDFLGLPDAAAGVSGGKALDTARRVDAFRTRFWNAEPYVVDILSVSLCT